MSRKIQTDEVVIELGSYLKGYNQGWLHIPKAVIRSKRLTDPEFRVWCLLYSYVGQKGIFPSMKTLATDLGSSLNKIRMNIDKLNDKGFLNKKRRGYGKSNTYELTVPTDVMEEFQKALDKVEDILPREVEYELKELGFTLGTKIGTREISILKASKEVFDEGMNLIEYIFQAEKDLQLAIITFLKKFGQAPSKVQISEFDYYIEQEGIKVLVEAIAKAKKNNNAIRENIEEGKERIKQKGTFKRKQYEAPKNETAKANPYQKKFEGFL